MATGDVGLRAKFPRIGTLLAEAERPRVAPDARCKVPVLVRQSALFRILEALLERAHADPAAAVAAAVAEESELTRLATSKEAYASVGVRPRRR
ncbi:hypothetical protein KFE25_011287 [Diacronema lutheri]|uniref:Uncharacterized protein n=1 Tax=Diacronema lutheri TaxID=2081491 RepID=A0A8J6BZZ5_DIALT|nr:hypothetical protein KFE25_011287 [Diacronema lutheri]